MTLENTNIVEQGLFGDTEMNNRQIEDNSRKQEQLSDLTSKTSEGFMKSKGETMPIVLNVFSNKAMQNWKSHEEFLRKALKCVQTRNISLNANSAMKRSVNT